MHLVENEFGCVLPVCRVTVRSDIPLARGLGSSASALVAGILGAFALCGLPVDEEKALALATRAEGHPDNVAPAVKGGFTVASGNGKDLYVQRLRVPDDVLRAVVASPSDPLSTEEMRKVLPKEVPLTDAVCQVQHACLLVSALQNGDWKALSEAAGDNLFTPYRKARMPYLEDAFRTGKEAGALCCMISGSGPSVLALTDSDEAALRVRNRWEDLFGSTGCPCRVRILQIDRDGATLSEEPEDE
ncbi:MAG: homoserine kinase [Clostridia bacterium]|nr:homoserine kinase [Clostridia bacterium]